MTEHRMANTTVRLSIAALAVSCAELLVALLPQ